MKSTKSPSWIERLLGFGPIAAPPHSFGCDGRYLVYGGFRGGRGANEAVSLMDWQSDALSADLFPDGLLGGAPRDPEAFRTAVAAFVSRLSSKPKEACLVLPDAWLRLAVCELDDLPDSEAEQETVLRWKLKRLVPFRVDELRVRGRKIAPLPGQREAHRLLLGFGLESMLRSLEQAFEAAGVRLGLITNESLGVLASLRRKTLGEAGQDGFLAQLRVTQRGYSLTVADQGEPVLHRFKSFSEGLNPETEGRFVVRDLRLTASYLKETFPSKTLNKVLLAAPGEVIEPWTDWLSQGFEQPVETLGAHHLAVNGTSLPPFHEVASLAGAVREAVA